MEREGVRSDSGGGGGSGGGNLDRVAATADTATVNVPATVTGRADQTSLVEDLDDKMGEPKEGCVDGAKTKDGAADPPHSPPAAPLMAPRHPLSALVLLKLLYTCPTPCGGGAAMVRRAEALMLEVEKWPHRTKAALKGRDKSLWAFFIFIRGLFLAERGGKGSGKGGGTSRRGGREVLCLFSLAAAAAADKATGKERSDEAAEHVREVHAGSNERDAAAKQAESELAVGTEDAEGTKQSEDRSEVAGAAHVVLIARAATANAGGAAERVLDASAGCGDADVPFRPLFVMGDSHTLTFAWRTVQYRGATRTLVPWLLTGIKAWHTRPAATFYTHANLRRALASLPRGTTEIVFSCGEIDAREGIGAAVDKGKYGSVGEAVRVTVGEYVSALRGMAVGASGSRRRATRGGEGAVTANEDDVGDAGSAGIAGEGRHQGETAAAAAAAADVPWTGSWFGAPTMDVIVLPVPPPALRGKRVMREEHRGRREEIVRLFNERLREEIGSGAGGGGNAVGGVGCAAATGGAAGTGVVDAGGDSSALAADAAAAATCVSRRPSAAAKPPNTLFFADFAEALCSKDGSTLHPRFDCDHTHMNANVVPFLQRELCKLDNNNT